MAIAGAVVVPLQKDMESGILDRLRTFDEIEIKDIGQKGIALVMESPEVKRLQEISREIEEWEEVIEFNLAYLNWEELEEKPS